MIKEREYVLYEVSIHIVTSEKKAPGKDATKLGKRVKGRLHRFRTIARKFGEQSLSLQEILVLTQVLSFYLFNDR